MPFYIARRLAWTAIVVAVVMLLTFVVFYKLPNGDPAVRFAGKAPTPELLHEIRMRLGLNHPWYVQFGRFVKNFFTGDSYGWP
jgi:peptide/nickel transport system permease protein